MVTTYHIGSIVARLKLTALRARHGEVIRDGLSWRLTSQGNRSAEYKQDEAQPEMGLPEGAYQIEATYNNKTYLLAKSVFLAKNTLTDFVFILDLAGEIGAFEAEKDYFRRELDRKAQQKFGLHSSPLHDPNRPKMPGGGLPGHPLLNTAQFDGMEPKINPQPSENEQATAKTIELQLQKQQALQHGAHSTPILTR